MNNFVAAPYPLEYSDDGETWHLVLGWTDLESGAILPVLAPGQVGHYRQAAPASTIVRVASPSPRPVAAPARSTTSSV